MLSEDEEYYDSIDDTEFEKCRSFCNEKFHEDDSEIDESECNKIAELIPFYTGNVEKCEVESGKKDSKSNSLATLRNAKLRRKSPVISLTDQRKNRSYLTMFYAKSGHLNKTMGNLQSTRATCSELSPKRAALNEDYEESSCFAKINSERFLEHPSYTTQSVIVGGIKCESNSSLDSELFSVSQAHFNSLVPSREQPKRDGSNQKSKPMKMTELGGLGPNIAQEKLQLLRRRQDYGRTVSEKNRIKIMENKVVRKLRQEIRESNRF